MTPDTVTVEAFQDIIPTMGLSVTTMEELDEHLAKIDEFLLSVDPNTETLSDYIRGIIYEVVAVIYNKSGSRYANIEAQQSAIDAITTKYNEMRVKLSEIQESIKGVDKTELKAMFAEFDNIGQVLR